MKVFIAGIDGYLGWALAQYLAARGHQVGGIDAGLRRQWVAEVGGISAIPIYTMERRRAAFEKHFGSQLDFRSGNLLDYPALSNFLNEFQPDAIVHLGEMPSAAYSMISPSHAAFTQHNNVIGNLNILWAMKEVCPEAHLIKLGTMGEYGTPNIDIPEGFFEVEFRGRKTTLPFPRQPGSYYHLSKVHDSHNTAFACQVWGLRSTDIMQGVVFGTQVGTTGDIPEMRTRLDFDQCFGTVINRFCCQAIMGHPLTVYGVGRQKRGFLPLRDAMQCLSLVIENPPGNGEYRVINQFDACYTVSDLALIVQEVSQDVGLSVDIAHYENPRHETEQNYYNPDREKLVQLGYKPAQDIASELRIMLADLSEHSQRIQDHAHILVPDIRWDGSHQRSRTLQGDQMI